MTLKRKIGATCLGALLGLESLAFGKSIGFSPSELTWISTSSVNSGLSLSIGTMDAKKRINIDLDASVVSDTAYLATLKSCEFYALWVKSQNTGTFVFYSFPDSEKATDGASGAETIRVTANSKPTIQCMINN
jgi:hypothetical protein